MPSRHDPTSPSGGDAAFETTHWSVVLAAGRREAVDASPASPDAEEALATLCGNYWYPLYAFVRRRGADVHEAQELTQAFFARLLEKNYLADARPERGRFRTFLLACLQHFLANERDRAAAKKRGGGRRVISLDFETGESRYVLEPVDRESPVRIFEREWARTLVRRVMDRLGDEQRRAGKAEHFQRLKWFIGGDADDAAYDEAAEKLGLSVNAAYVAVHRLRRRYRELLRAEIAHTVADPREVDDEIAGLFAALGP